MFYEEKLINGIMHWRSSPNDDFQPYTLEELSVRYEYQRQALNEAQTKLYEQWIRDNPDAIK